MTIVDSSVLVASFLANDSQHEKAQRALKKLKNIGCPEYVVLEVANVLHNKKEHVLASSFLTLIEASSDISILLSTPTLLAETMELFRADRFSKLSFVDAALVVLSRDNEILTFDAALARAIASRKR